MHIEDFNAEKAASCSFAVKFLYSWIMAMYDFNKVYLETQPLREKLAVSMKIVATKTAELKLKKDALDQVNRKI